MRELLLEKLKRILLEQGVAVEESTLPCMIDYLLFVLEKNRSINLTAINNYEEALRLHLEDSLLVLPLMGDAPEGPYADLGTGGGFPGVPLGMASGRNSTLMDSSSKKIAVINEYFSGAQTAWPIQGVAGRLEDLARAYETRFSIVTARALAALPSLLELASPLAQTGGRLIAMKGRLDPEEFDAGNRVARLVGFELVGDYGMTLSSGEERRQLVYEKMVEPSISLPRRNGLAQKRPLA